MSFFACVFLLERQHLSLVGKELAKTDLRKTFTYFKLFRISITDD